MRPPIAVVLVAALAVAFAGCIIEPDDPPSPTIRNDTAQDIWIGVELTDGVVNAQSRVDSDTTTTVSARCNFDELLVLDQRVGADLTRTELPSSGVEVMYVYDAVQNPPLCGEDHPDAVWVWNGRELVFTEED